MAGWRRLIVPMDEHGCTGGAYLPIYIERRMENLLDICAIEIWLIESDWQVESGVRESQYIPEERTQLRMRSAT